MFCIRDFDCSAIRMMRCILFGVGCRAAAAAAGVIPRPLYRSPQCSDCTSHCRGAACPSRSNTGSLHRVSKNGVHQLRL